MLVCWRNHDLIGWWSLEGNLVNNDLELVVKLSTNLLHLLLLVALNGIEARSEVFESAQEITSKTLGLGFPLVLLHFWVLHLFLHGGHIFAQLLEFDLCGRVTLILDFRWNLRIILVWAAYINAHYVIDRASSFRHLVFALRSWLPLPLASRSSRWFCSSWNLWLNCIH